MRSLAVISVLFVLCATALRADDSRRGGNWWLTQERSSKLSYALGIFDGMNVGSDFSIFGLPKGDSCVPKVNASYRSYGTKYIKDVTAGQLTDGLDDFYKDYRNRRIQRDTNRRTDACPTYSAGSSAEFLAGSSFGTSVRYHFIVDGDYR